MPAGELVIPFPNQFPPAVAADKVTAGLPVQNGPASVMVASGVVVMVTVTVAEAVQQMFVALYV